MNSLTDEREKPAKPRLLTQVRERIRFHHFALSTEKVYVHWIRFFIRFHELRHPETMGRVEVEAFLTHLASERNVAASTHRQALSALLFLYCEVLNIELPWMMEIGRPKTPQRLPEVLTVNEVLRTLALMRGEHATLAKLLYGTGMRILEGMRLRTKDVDFERGAIIVREAKGDKDRVVMVPRSLRDALKQQLRLSHALWEADRAAKLPGVEMPAHLLQSGADIHTVQTLLGHADVSTSKSLAARRAPWTRWILMRPFGIVTMRRWLDWMQCYCEQRQIAFV